MARNEPTHAVSELKVLLEVQGAFHRPPCPVTKRLLTTSPGRGEDVEGREVVSL